MSTNNIKCANHPDVGYDVAFHIPGVSVKFFCEPCAAEYRKTITTPYRGRREAWEETWDERREREANRYFFGDYEPERKWR